MHVLIISTDSKIFEPGSAVRERMKAYGDLIDRLDIVVLSKRGLPKKDFLAPKVWAFATNSFFKLSRFFDAYNLGKRVTPDLITCQDPFVTGLVGVLLRKKLGTKLELQVHTDLFDSNFVSFSLGNRLRSEIAKRLLPKADGVRVVSKRIVLNMIRAGVRLAKEPIVLPIFVAVDKIKATSIRIDLHQEYPQFDKIILMASRLVPEKNVELAIKALALVQAKLDKVGLVIAGDGPRRLSLEKMVKKSQLEAKVIFLGWQEDLVSLYKTADLFLQTSYYEGYGLSLVEAVSAGLPAVSTDVGVASELLGVVISPAEEDVMTKIVIDQLSNPRTIDAITSENKPRNVGAYSQQIVAVWHDILSN